ncbi:hypothetical protein SAMD00023353_0901930 [Rosellinia necatrix]|uniref:Uncharacterized protein n=1 Tax=Rosellinia necatrix TaxID=77044 RepID=A0A1S8A799_ROSNE|nr:hypothetical protein SAMD00023353_0901930 [Rosellinia necatrix]
MPDTENDRTRENQAAESSPNPDPDLKIELEEVESLVSTAKSLCCHLTLTAATLITGCSWMTLVRWFDASDTVTLTTDLASVMQDSVDQGTANGGGVIHV